MIYSSVNDNWMRVRIMHSVAKSYFIETKGSGFRERRISGGNPFPFDVDQHDTMEKESCLVGMIMAWSVITLESIVNHFLAEIIDSKEEAVKAIEYPNQMIGKKPKSQLAKKIVILSKGESVDETILLLADDLSERRNLIVHDKPFELIDFGEGEVEVDNFRSRGEPLNQTLRFDDLNSFYQKCDLLKDFMCSMYSEILDLEEVSFESLAKK